MIRMILLCPSRKFISIRNGAGGKMILPDEHYQTLLEIRNAANTALETNSVEDLLKNLAFVCVKSELLWNRVLGNEAEEE